MSLLRRVNSGLDRLSSQFRGKAVRFPTYGGDGGMGGWGDLWGSGGRTKSGTEFDYRTEAGLLWECGTVYSLLSWQAKQFRQAPFCVTKPAKKGRNIEHVPVDGHPLTKLLKRPNPFWTGAQLRSATLLSLGCAESGSSYWLKVRSPAGKVVQLWWLPHWMVTPMWSSSGTDFITAYRYRVEGHDFYYRPSEIVHFRNDLVNPANQRLSLAPFLAPLVEICTENSGGVVEAAMLRNRGIPGVIISPKESVVQATAGSEGWSGPTDTQRQKYKTLWRSFTNDGAGEPFVSTIPIDVAITQFSPDQMSLKDTRGTAVSRICSAFGVDPMVIGLPSEQKTYSNYKEALEAAWDHNVIPAQDGQAEQMDLQLLTEFSLDEDEQCAFDRSNVPALQEDRTEKYKRITGAVGGPWQTPNEGRAEAGLDPLPGKDELYPPKGAGGGKDGEDGETDGDESDGEDD